MNSHPKSDLTNPLPSNSDEVSRTDGSEKGDTWNLSDKIRKYPHLNKNGKIDKIQDISIKDVKEFIKRLKEDCWKKGNHCEHCDKIDKLAGEELSK